MAAGVNTTKVQAGGSGDNYVASGYIKTVEKIWLDSYTFNFTGTGTTVDIAIVPTNAKITSIDVEVYSTISQTSGVLAIGYSTDAAIDTFLPATILTHNLTRTSIKLPSGVFQGNVAAGGSAIQTVGNLSGFQNVATGTQTTISVKLTTWVASTGTLKSTVRYTT